MMSNNMGNPFLITILTFLSLVLATIVYLSLAKSSIISLDSYTPYTGGDDLGVALSAASTTDNTVIITFVNKAYVEPHNGTYPSMLELFLEGFWYGEDTRKLVDHLLVVAMDQTAYDRCNFRRLKCYKLETNGVDFAGEKIFMSGDYLKMMWRRTLFLSEVLKRGYSFFFTDTDILWLRNPFHRLQTINQTVNHEDLLISVDHHTYMNAGFYFIRANNKTNSLYDRWNGMKDKSIGINEQDVLNNLNKEGVFAQLDLRVHFLDTLYFNGFCTKTMDFQNVITIHANCCRTITAKVTDLMVVLRDWKNFKAKVQLARNNPQSETTTTLQDSYHFSCEKSWN